MGVLQGNEMLFFFLLPLIGESNADFQYDLGLNNILQQADGPADYYDLSADENPANFGYIVKQKQDKDQSKPDGRGKSSLLPAYCDPPNPCPKGYTQQDGCLEMFDNKAEFSRQFQSSQSCMCDTEHMFSCPQNDMNIFNKRADDLELPANPFGEDDLDLNNPFLAGQQLPIAAKKGVWNP